MAFTNNFRIERIYFEKLKSNIDILKSYIEAGATGEALELLKNSVDVNGAVLLLYRNLGEAWAELADLIQKTQKDLKDLAEKTDAYHDELNERIDEVNNYLMALIRELDARLQVVEQDLATMNRNKFYDLVENDGSYLIEKEGETVSFDEIKADADFPHDVILRYDNGTSETELEIREFTDSRIDFYSIGLADSDTTVKEILVSIDDTEAVTYSEKTLENPLYTFGTGLSLDSDNELSVDFDTVQGKLAEGTGIDIDSNNEISVDTSVVQSKLTEGFGIDIDSNNEIKVDTADVQEKLIAGQNITLTPDTTDPTKTVIDAQGGATVPLFNLYHDSSNVSISVPFNFAQYTTDDGMHSRSVSHGKYESLDLDITNKKYGKLSAGSNSTKRYTFSGGVPESIIFHGYFIAPIYLAEVDENNTKHTVLSYTFMLPFYLRQYATNTVEFYKPDNLGLWLPLYAFKNKKCRISMSSDTFRYVTFARNVSTDANLVTFLTTLSENLQFFLYAYDED